MANLPTRTTASFDAIKPVLSLVLLDDEFNDMKGAAGFLNGGTTGKKLLIKTSDAADPPVDCDQVGAGPLARWKLSGTAKVTITNAGAISLASMTACPNLNADQVDGIEGANIAKLDTHKTAWSFQWFDFDPSASSVSTEDRMSFLVPDGASIVITKFRIKFSAGSRTAGAGNTITYTFIHKNSAGGGGSFGSISINDTNNTKDNVYTVTLGSPEALTSGDSITITMTRSGTNTERAVTVAAIGTQKFTT